MRLTRVKIHPVYGQTHRNTTEVTVNHALGVGSQLNPTISGVGEVGFMSCPRWNHRATTANAITKTQFGK
jgi:hypothetical protein